MFSLIVSCLRPAGGSGLLLAATMLMALVSQAQTPTITGISPSSGAPGTIVTITGTQLSTARRVYFDSADADTLTVVSATEIRTVFPATASTGYVTLVVGTDTVRSTQRFVRGADWTSARRFSPDSAAQFKHIMRDSTGNGMYVIGDGRLGAQLGGGLTLASAGAFLARYDTLGTPQWLMPLPPANTIRVSGQSPTTWLRESQVVVDAAGAVYLSSVFADSITFGTTTLRAPAGELRCFLAKLNAAGQPQWAVQVSPNSSLRARVKLTLDEAQRPALAFFADTGTVIGSMALPTADVVIARFTPATGILYNVLRAQGSWPAGTIQNFKGISVGFDDDGTAYLGTTIAPRMGFFTDSLRLGGHSIGFPYQTDITYNLTDLVYFALTPAGTIPWVRHVYGEGSEGARLLLVDRRRNVLYASMTMTPGQRLFVDGQGVGQSHTALYWSFTNDDLETDPVILSLNLADGAPRWTSVASSPLFFDNIPYLELDRAGNLYLGANLNWQYPPNANATLGGAIIPGIAEVGEPGWAWGGEDPHRISVVGKYTPSGDLMWLITPKGRDGDVSMCQGIAVTTAGNVITGVEAEQNYGYPAAAPIHFGATAFVGNVQYLATLAALPVQLRAVSPASAAPGAQVMFTGQSLSNLTSFFIGGVPAVFTVISDDSVLVTIPMLPVGPALVQGTNLPNSLVSGPAFTVLRPTGLSAPATEKGFTLYPNPTPTPGPTRIVCDRNAVATNIQVTDGLGRIVYTLTLPIGQTEALLPLAGWPTGVYAVRVGQTVRKLVIE